MRAAAIDIGTNSVLLVVAESQPDGVPSSVVERATITRLGRGVDRTRRLEPDAVDRTLECLREYARTIRDAGAGSLDVVGTSAMRDASGGEDFIRQAEGILGMAPRVISGEEEAELTFRGAGSGLPLTGPVVVVDIGGGSTEVIRGAIEVDGARIESAASLDVGSVRLTERHLGSDPPTADEIRSLRGTVRSALNDLPDGTKTPAELVGVAGTITTLAAIEKRLDVYEAGVVHGARLERSVVEALQARLASLPLAERRELVGLEPKRADVIVAGATIISEVMRYFEAPTLLVSDRGVRWGLLQRLLSPV